MRISVRTLAAVVFSAGFLLGSGAVLADTSLPMPARGGFTGPGPALATVKQALSMRDDMPVTLKGYIVQSLGDEKYLFKDATGTIRVEIDHDVWQGLQVAPQDLVEIQGEVDRDWSKIKVEVSRISKVQ
ncbi:MAG: YgiW/YdeI family stress tolerance OB fold protein [Oxalobacter formigenes]|nr:YgiW/YdeI family stress tolerance OB fold protein [Oxalobacter formigenes]